MEEEREGFGAFVETERMELEGWLGGISGQFGARCFGHAEGKRG